MVCQACGRIVRVINARHLKSCSGFSVREYTTRFPDAQLADADVRASYGMPLEHNPNWRGRTGRTCTNCGKPLSRKNMSGLCHRCAVMGDRNPFAGQHHTPETRERMRQSAKLRDPETYQGGVASSEVLSAARKKQWAAVPLEERVARLQTFIAAGQATNKKSTQTAIENRVAAMLDGLGVSYRRTVRIGRYYVDLLVGERIVIECFGDYWHCNPRIYAPDYDHTLLHMRAEDKWKRDQQRRDAIEQTGYTVVIIWEYDIDYTPEAVEAQLKRLLQIDV